MSSDTYTNHSVCYLNDAWKIGTVHGLLYFGYKMFAKAYRVSNFEGIKRNIQANEQNGSEEHFFDDIFIEEILLDSIKISICFENYLKAQLLHKGFVIHQIES